jgi:hypothetical protein
MVLFIGLWGGAAAVAMLEVDGYLLFSAAVFGLVGGMEWFWIVVTEFRIQLQSAIFYQIWLYEPIRTIIAWNISPDRWVEISSVVNPLLGVGYLGLTVLCLSAALGD